MSSLNSAANPSLLTLAAFAAGLAMFVSFSVDASIEARPAAAMSYGHRGGHFYEPPTLAPSAIVLAGAPTYQIEPDKVSFYFSGRRVQLRQDANPALQSIADASQPGLVVHIAGFHSLTNGNPQPNIALAHQRALAVQKRLADLGVPLSAIQVNKPVASKNVQLRTEAEVQRVEVTLLRKP